MLPLVEPMLALSGIPTDTLDRYAAEPKLDGWRSVVSVEPGEIAQGERGAWRDAEPDRCCCDVDERVAGWNSKRTSDARFVVDAECVLIVIEFARRDE